MTTAPVLRAEGRRIAPEGLPPENRTLGWRILQWTSDWLRQPDGPNAKEPWRYTNEQVRNLLWWYAIDDHGQFVYRYGMLRRLKGWGKDPYICSLCLVELIGPCRFGGWDANGYPIAQSHPAAWVQVAAVSKDQNRNTMTLVPGMLSPEAREEYQVDLGKEIIYAMGGTRRMEAITSSPASVEGGRPTFVVKSETQHWKPNNGGDAMSEVIARNAGKSRDGASRAFAHCNAHAPGEGSDAERDWEAWVAGADDMLFDSLEAPAQVREVLQRVKSGHAQEGDEEYLVAALEFARGESHWLNIDRLMAEILDPRTSIELALRFYYNLIAASEARAFDRQRFEELEKPDYSVASGSLIVLGFDGSVSRDHTALVGTEVATGYQWIVGYWEPLQGEDGEMHVDVQAVDETMAAAFERWDVWRLNADPFYWKEQLAQWAGRYNRPSQPRVVEWNTTLYRRMAYAIANYRTAIQSGELSHDGDMRLVNAIGNSYKRMQQFLDDNGERMWTITKERPDSPLKIDAAMAAILSWEARNAAVASGSLEGAEQSIYEERGLRRL